MSWHIRAKETLTRQKPLNISIMTMSMTILYHKDFVTSTIVSEFPKLPVAPSPTSNGLQIQTLESAPETHRRSKRDGRLPRRVERAIKEATDPDFSAQMQQARQAWAKEAYDTEPDSLAKARLSKGLSQAQLAEAIGTSQSHIAKIESGQVRIYLDTARRLAEALSLDMKQLSTLVHSNDAKTSSRGV